MIRKKNPLDIFKHGIRRRKILGLVLLGWTGRRSAASTFLEKHLLIVVPNPPGGGIDLIARLMSKPLSDLLGNPVIVANRSGASGMIGTSSVKQAPPDGKTVLFTGLSHLVTPRLVTPSAYEPLSDFQTVGRLAFAPGVLISGNSAPIFAATDLKSFYKNSGRELIYGSAGVGHTSHIAMEALLLSIGTKGLHVPYRGTSQAIQGLISGEIDAMLGPIGALLPVINSKRVRPVSVAYPNRVPVMPDVPSLREQGITDADFSQWYGVFAPRGTPNQNIDYLSKQLEIAMNSPSLTLSLDNLGVQRSYQGPEEFYSFLKTENKKLTSLINRIGLDRLIKN